MCLTTRDTNEWLLIGWRIAWATSDLCRSPIFFQLLRKLSLQESQQILIAKKKQSVWISLYIYGDFHNDSPKAPIRHHLRYIFCESSVLHSRFVTITEHYPTDDVRVLFDARRQRQIFAKGFKNMSLKFDLLTIINKGINVWWRGFQLVV